VGVDAHVSSSARQTFPFAIWYMLLSLWVSVLLSHTKVYHIYSVCRLVSRTADEEVIRFDVAINEVFLMYGLNSSDLPTVPTMLA
jgi:hypothetical protein